MKTFALIGYPLGHSMSGVIHKELFRISKMDAQYKLIEINPDDLNSSFDELKQLNGFNVTIPHKINIIPNLNSLSERAQLFGAVNTVDNKNGMSVGYNTDCHGFLRALDMSGITLGGKVLLCGSGGVSRMFAFESVMAGADLTIAVREADIDAGNAIKQEIKDKLDKDVDIVLLQHAPVGCDLVINGTPVGMHPYVDACPVDERVVKSAKAVFDAVYNPEETLFIRYAKEAGIKYCNGLPMLVWQAAVAEEIWNGVKFTNEDVKEVIAITQKELNK